MPILDRCIVCAVRCSRCKACVDGNEYKALADDVCVLVKVSYSINCLSDLPKSAIAKR